MNLPAVREWCRTRPGATEEEPFGPGTIVYKVAGKMFAICPEDSDQPSVSLKCDPRWAEHLRQTYPGVGPGYHLNKRHWNTVRLDGSVPPNEVLEMLGHSYTLVVGSLPKSLSRGLG